MDVEDEGKVKRGKREEGGGKREKAFTSSLLPLPFTSYFARTSLYGFGAAGAAAPPRPAGAGVAAGGFGAVVAGGVAAGGFGAAAAGGVGVAGLVVPVAGAPCFAAAAASNRLITSGVMSSDGSTKMAPASPMLKSRPTPSCLTSASTTGFSFSWKSPSC